MKIFILNAVLAASTVSSLVLWYVSKLLSLQWHWYHLMAKCLYMCRLVHHTAVMARGMYSIGNRFQITLLLLFAMVVAEVQTYRDTLSSRAWSHQTLTCSLNYSFLYEEVHCLSREAVEARWVTAARLTVEDRRTLIVLQQHFDMTDANKDGIIRLEECQWLDSPVISTPAG